MLFDFTPYPPTCVVVLLGVFADESLEPVILLTSISFPLRSTLLLAETATGPCCSTCPPHGSASGTRPVILCFTVLFTLILLFVVFVAAVAAGPFKSISAAVVLAFPLAFK